MNHIITISREFGSGGRTVGKKVAEQLGIPCYDSELIQKIAEESGRGVPFLMEILGTSSEYRARKIAETAAKFSLPALTNGVRLCAECAMKPRENGAITDAEAIKEFLIRFAMESRRA